METLHALLRTPEFWMGLSVLAAALPGPQTRLLPALFRALARGLAAARSSVGGGR